MVHLERDFRVVAFCGGSGSVSIIDSLLDITPNVTSITGVHDNGGHSGEIRSELGLLPPGDATHQIAVHIRDERVRRLFTKRWDLDNKKNPINGHRPGNELLAAAEDETNSHSEGIKLIEYAYRADYLGRVIPISNDNVHIRVFFADGTSRDGESSVDEVETNDPPIVNVEYIPDNPTPNSEALEHTVNAHMIWLPPTTFWGSQVPLLKTPGIREAIRISKAPIVWIPNATKTLESNGFTTTTLAEKLVDMLGREIDYAFVNTPAHDLPQNYIDEKSIFMVNDLKKNNPYVKRFFNCSLTEVKYIEGKFVIRHNGELTCQNIINKIPLKIG